MLAFDSWPLTWEEEGTCLCTPTPTYVGVGICAGVCVFLFYVYGLKKCKIVTFRLPNNIRHYRIIEGQLIPVCDLDNKMNNNIKLKKITNI